MNTPPGTTLSPEQLQALDEANARREAAEAASAMAGSTSSKSTFRKSGFAVGAMLKAFLFRRIVILSAVTGMILAAAALFTIFGGTSSNAIAANPTIDAGFFKRWSVRSDPNATITHDYNPVTGNQVWKETSKGSTFIYSPTADRGRPMWVDSAK